MAKAKAEVNGINTQVSDFLNKVNVIRYKMEGMESELAVS